MRVNNPHSKAGFTLVEILIVIAIIALLAGGSFVAMRSARSFVGAATARQRLDDISQGLEHYKLKYGEYPPDCTATDAEIQRHILKRWPRVLKTGKVGDMVGIARGEMDKGPGWAPLFWMAGLGSELEVNDPQGFLADPEEPIDYLYDISEDAPREEPIIELSRDSDGSGGGNYNDLGLMFNGKPIIYFRSEGKNGYDGKDYHVDDGMIAAPYMKDGQWYNPDSFQLIYAGEDGDFGSDSHESHGGDHEHGGRDLSDPDTLTQADKDNITNFTNGATLESEIE